MERLQEILMTMDVPSGRKLDIHWLKRNINIRNFNHPDIVEANSIINQLLKNGE